MEALCSTRYTRDTVAEILRLIEIFICLLSFLIISADLNIFIYAFLI